MELKNCKKCGRLHNGTGKICSECLKKEEEKFNLVKSYLKEYPDSSLIKVSDETGVTVAEIERFLREGRLQVTTGMSDFLKCMKCGSPITTGRYCPECEKKVMNDVKTVYRSVVSANNDDGNKKGGPKMHTKFGERK